MSALGMPRQMVTLDPRNVEHLLKSKFLCDLYHVSQVN